MDTLYHLSLDLDFEKLYSRLRAKLKRDWQRIQPLFEAAASLIVPKTVYRVAFIDEKNEDQVIIDGISFKSRVLRKNLDAVRRAFPYVVTIGSKLEEKASTCKNTTEKLYYEMIGNHALILSLDMLKKQLCSKFGFDRMSYMSPGSIKDWPIEEQRPLFSLLSGVEETIGVRLSENLLMIPKKSVSGIYFPTEVTFYSCQLCPLERCEGRRAAFSEALIRKYGLQPSTQ